MTGTPARKWIGAGIVAGVLLVLAGWVLVVAPQRASAAARWADLAATQTQAGTIRASNAKLAAQMTEIDARRAALALKREALPESNSLDLLVAALAAAAESAGVTVDELTAIAPVDISAVLVPAVVVDPTVATDTTATTDTPAATAAYYALPVTIRVIGPLANLQEFLRLVQTEQPRTILFRSLLMANDEGSGSLEESGVLTAETQVFVSPGAEVAAGTTPVQ